MIPLLTLISFYAPEGPLMDLAIIAGQLETKYPTIPLSCSAASTRNLVHYTVAVLGLSLPVVAILFFDVGAARQAHLGLPSMANQAD
jgi:hypothetical protein